MVYGGRPSRGCRTCRTRRIKCDEGKPTCQQCAKSRRECGGYRSEFEIVHRDQTKSTLRRMRRALDTRQLPPTPTVVFLHERPELSLVGASPRERPPQPAQLLLQRETSSPPPLALALPVIQRAACFFASNFILIPSTESTPHGFMEYLLPLIDSAAPDSALSHAFNACAFASLGNRVKADDVDFSALSLKQHTSALKQAQIALSDPAAANTDATLASVLLLSLYESITATESSGLLAWRSHIDGAVNIVKARGRAQMYQTKTGTDLFNGVRHVLISRTLSAGVSPPLGADWWVDADDESLIAISHRFAFRTSELRVETCRLLLNSARDPEWTEQVLELAKRVQQVDHEVATWLITVPSEFRFRTLCWINDDNTDSITGASHDEAEVFPGRVDLYPDYVTAGIWNIGRVTRLILASLSIRITACLSSPLDYRATPEYTTLKNICLGTISEIIASVPYHLGWHAKQPRLLEDKSSLLGFACGEEVPLKALPSFLLIWSLACIKTHDVTTDSQRAWVQGRLKFIEESVGIKYSGILNEVPLRFPSMMIRQDGMMRVPDILGNGEIEAPMLLAKPNVLPVPRDWSDSPSLSYRLSSQKGKCNAIGQSHSDLTRDPDKQAEWMMMDNI